MNAESFSTNDEVFSQSDANALRSVNALDLPIAINISSDSFLGLGSKTSNRANAELNSLRAVHGENLPYLIGIALRKSWFALYAKSGYMSLSKDAEVVRDNGHTRSLYTPEGYGEIMGIAWTLHSLQDLNGESAEEATFREGTPFGSCLSVADTMNGVAVYWFAMAATELRAGNTESCLNWLDEAYEALSTVTADEMWDLGEKLGNDSEISNIESSVLSKLGKKAAQARHIENRSMKADAFKWLDDNMASPTSMDAAAAEIVKQQPIVFRTARDWVAEWKKLRSARRP